MSQEHEKKVCLCKAVLESTIKEAIRQGAKTVDQVASRTGSTKGACQGNRCREQIQMLLESYQKGEWK